jgi:hypothetical protein
LSRAPTANTAVPKLATVLRNQVFVSLSYHPILEILVDITKDLRVILVATDMQFSPFTGLVSVINRRNFLH